MNRLDEVFLPGKKKLLNVYFTAGFPGLNFTMDVMLALQKHGADIIEIGMPFSDPIADGPVIQESNKIALRNGMNLDVLFHQLNQVKEQVSIPVILMGYLNPVLQYGIEKFCQHAAHAGVHGIILPDLPLYEFKKNYAAIFKKHGLHVIFLITPEMSAKRVKETDKSGSGFLYALSESVTTGNRVSQKEPGKYLQKFKKLKLVNPILVGFGIKDHTGFEKACLYAQGAIIGSAYIKLLNSNSNIDVLTADFIHSIKGTII